MIHTLAVNNYRSLLHLVMPLAQLTVVTGANGSGKSNLYRALRLLAETAQGGLNGGVIPALARQGGLESVFWAGPESLSKGMQDGSVEIQGGPRTCPVRLKLGFNADDYGYAIELGLPEPSHSLFYKDPEIKREVIWAGDVLKPSTVLVERKGPLVRVKSGRSWHVANNHTATYDSLFSLLTDATLAPEILMLRERIRDWRFYDQFRTDPDAPARRPGLGTRTPVLAHDGCDLAAALQTIREIGDTNGLDAAIDDAFPGARLTIDVSHDGYFSLHFSQPGLLRPLDCRELSDGTLRYVLLVTALLSPRPPSLLVLNEPETSLHPDLLPSLARLITQAATRSQVWVVSHSAALVETLLQSHAPQLAPGATLLYDDADDTLQQIRLLKTTGQTLVDGQHRLNMPAWRW